MKINDELTSRQITGMILQLKIHEGESSQANSRTPLMIIGDTNELYLRVNINQLEVAYFSSEAPAVAFLQGDAQSKLSLEFIRVEPFLVTKEEITNAVSEKVDTRTFQIIYKIKNSPSTLFTGARMDVFIERKPR
jgi:HlyD family secretion protein